MAEKTQPRNPYIAGRALGQEHGFFGRQDIIDLVTTELASPERSAMVLFGQRRIGKTSILLQLRRYLPSPPFTLAYFDLMDRARQPMSHVLFELASVIAEEVCLAPVTGPEDFDDAGLSFRQQFLPVVYKTMGVTHRLVLLFDEFDVLDMAAEEQLPPTAAARCFFSYLRQLMEQESRLGFVFVVGRKAEELSIDVKATFKAARYKRVSVLDAQSARELITIAQRQETLAFTEAAIERILAMTSGHPYFTQLICQLLWDGAYTNNPQDIPAIEVYSVEAMIPKALEAGENIFAWIWDGLPPAERVIFAAIAEETNEQTVVTEEEILDILQRHGIRILTRELELAPGTLVQWEMLRKTDGGYGFFIELMRRWVITHQPLPKVKDELDRIIPLADILFQSGHGFYRQGDLGNTQNQLEQALRINPNHLKARLLLSQVLLEQDKLAEAVRELQEAYRYDADVARYPLIRTLLVQGEKLEREGQGDEVLLMVYDQVLGLSPRERVAQERRAAIWAKCGDEAVRTGDLESALAAYQKAEMQEKIAEVEVLKRERELLTLRYAEGLEAIQQKKWPQALRVLADVVHVQPDYKDAAELLARAVREQRATIEQPTRVKNHMVQDQEVNHSSYSSSPSEDYWLTQTQKMKALEIGAKSGKNNKIAQNDKVSPLRKILFMIVFLVGAFFAFNLGGFEMGLSVTITLGLVLGILFNALDITRYR